MSFDFYLTRSFVPGLEKQIDPSQLPLTEADFELLMDGGPIMRRLESGSCWLLHPTKGPWLSASFRQGRTESESHILLSVSYGNKQFLSVWADAFSLALRLAKSISCRVFEGSLHIEVRNENLESLLSPESDFARQQFELWKKTVSEMDRAMLAPLEFPIDSYDAVDEYFLFFLEPERKYSMKEIVADLALCIDPDSLTENSFALVNKDSGDPQSRVLLRSNDAAWQIYPFHWLEPFSVVANATHELALKLHKRMGGKLFYRDQELNPQLSEQLKAACQGLGVEFFLWQQKQKR
ncbi:MAG: hypothetical protein K2X27_00880 [Candidatus Obscuribacterales bacterium]|nr:hypothetical protein [Candidatus Obscuribacterales bacterium]